MDTNGFLSRGGSGAPVGVVGSSSSNGAAAFSDYNPFYSSSSSSASHRQQSGLGEMNNHHQFASSVGDHQQATQLAPSTSTPTSSSASSSARASSEQQEYVPTYSEAFPPLPDQPPGGGVGADPLGGGGGMPPHFVQSSNTRFQSTRHQQQQQQQQKQQQAVPVQARAPGSAWPPQQQDTGQQQRYGAPNGSVSKPGRSGGKGGGAQQQPLTKSLMSSKRTESIVVPLEERRMFQKNHDVSSNSKPSEVAASEHNACMKIREETGVDVEAEVTANNSLRIMLYGKDREIEQARMLVKKRLLTEGSAIVHIPKEHHKMLLGKKGERLNEIQNRTGARINIPHVNDQSDEIKLSGPRECIAEARRALLSISDMESKRGFERLTIPKMFHPIIRGARSCTIEALQQRWPGVKVNMPPPNIASDELTITGDKESVQAVKKEIERIHKNAESNWGTLSVQIPAERHKYLLSSKGEALHDILAQTGVTVELPPKADASQNVLLRGDQRNLGTAVSLLINKANSVKVTDIDCPEWLHARLIGRGGQAVKELGQRYPEVHVAFESDENKIRLEGTPQQVDMLQQELSQQVAELRRTLTFQDVRVAKPELIKHIIGKAGTNVQRLRQEYDVQVRIPEDKSSSFGGKGGGGGASKSSKGFAGSKKSGGAGAGAGAGSAAAAAAVGGDDVIRIEGTKQGVEAAVKELKHIIHRIENEVTKDVPIDYRLHRIMIGQKGDKVEEIRVKFPEVSINFPDSTLKSSSVQLRGPKEDVEKCAKYMANHAKILAEQNYQIEVPVFPGVVPKIIGKGGANIMKIRSETETRIDMPNENSGDTSSIRITGRKADVEEARKRIQAIQDEQANLLEITIDIPHQFHNALIGPRGSRIRGITQDCGNVHIKFPDSESGSNTVTVRGLKADVEKAKRKLTEIAEQRELSSYTHELKVKPDLHRFVIGSNGANINRVREKFNVQVAIPGRNDDNNDTIVIIGRKENVEKARADIEKLVEEMADMAEETVVIPKEFNNYLRSRNNQLYNEVEEKFKAGNSFTMSAPRRNEEQRQQRQQQQQQQRADAAAAAAGNATTPAVNGTTTPAVAASGEESVVLRGAKDAVEYVKQRIGELQEKWHKFTTGEMNIAPEHQRQVIGYGGLNVNEICDKYEVQIKFPERLPRPDDEYYHQERQGRGGAGRNGRQPPKPAAASTVTPTENAADGTPPVENNNNKENDNTADNSKESALHHVVRITGLPEAIENAKQALLALIPVSIEMPVPFKHHRMLIGQKGQHLQEFQKTHSVNVRVPRQELKSDIVTIIGAPKNVEKAKAEIEKFTEKYDRENFELEMRVDSAYHQRIIGKRGVIIDQLRKTHNVNIAMPRDQSDVITIVGTEENTRKAREEIESLVAEYANEVKYEVDIDPRVHRRIIGGAGANLKKLMKDFSVDIKFPRWESNDAPDKVYVTGTEENVTKCIDKLTSLEEEYLESANDFEPPPRRSAPDGDSGRGGDRGGERSERGGRGGGRGGGGRGGGGRGGGGRGGDGGDRSDGGAGGMKAEPSRGFHVRDAPWQSGAVPNANSFDDFPSFGAGGSAKRNATNTSEINDVAGSETKMNSNDSSSAVAVNENNKNDAEQK